jgi:hypothetical protein
VKENMLEVGDELFTYGQYTDSSMYYAGKIDRVTATMAFIGETKLRRGYNGHTERPGEFSYSSKFYYLLDEENRSKLEQQQKRRMLLKPLFSMIDNGRQSVARLSDSQLERINAILEEVSE